MNALERLAAAAGAGAAGAAAGDRGGAFEPVHGRLPSIAEAVPAVRLPVQNVQQPTPKRRGGAAAGAEAPQSTSKKVRGAKARSSEAAKPKARAQLRRWTFEEDCMLITAYQLLGDRRWKKVAAVMGGIRDGNQCCQRWRRVLCPNIKKGRWTPDEDQELHTAVRLNGENSWKRTALALGGRTDIQCRYRWFRLKSWNADQDLLALDKLPEGLKRYAELPAREFPTAKPMSLVTGAMAQPQAYPSSVTAVHSPEILQDGLVKHLQMIKDDLPPKFIEQYRNLINEAIEAQNDRATKAGVPSAEPAEKGPTLPKMDGEHGLLEDVELRKRLSETADALTNLVGAARIVHMTKK